jgi:hypothetical protein
MPPRAVHRHSRTRKDGALSQPAFEDGLKPRAAGLATNSNRNIRATVKKSFARQACVTSCLSFRHGGFTEGADADLTDAESRAAGRHRSARQLPTYAKRTRKADFSRDETGRKNKCSQFVGMTDGLCRNEQAASRLSH